MTILEFKRYFKAELSGLYSEGESGTLYSIFIYKVVGFDRFQQRRFMHQELLKNDENILNRALESLKTGKPYQQILGETEFFGVNFFVDENVLIPRPETEELLEYAIYEIQNYTQKFQISTPKLVDIGTGSGVIPIILKKHFPDAQVSAIDISEKALDIAERNARLHQVSIDFIKMDYLNEDLDEGFDVIISNPPYIGIDEKSEITHSVRSFEPNIALFSPTEDALIFYKKIAKDAQEILSENGLVFLEINQKLGGETLSLFENFSFSKLLKDISGNDRIIMARK